MFPVDNCDLCQFLQIFYKFRTSFAEVDDFLLLQVRPGDGKNQTVRKEALADYAEFLLNYP
jgi:hypothetical protein